MPADKYIFEYIFAPNRGYSVMHGSRYKSWEVNMYFINLPLFRIKRNSSWFIKTRRNQNTCVITLQVWCRYPIISRISPVQLRWFPFHSKSVTNSDLIIYYCNVCTINTWSFDFILCYVTPKYVAQAKMDIDSNSSRNTRNDLITCIIVKIQRYDFCRGW